jgi:regulation of enolase protein 1 (concanavalin A-like superfamily)
VVILKKDKKGQGLVEFALILPVLLLVLLGIIEASWLIWSYITVQNAAREAARYAVTGAPLDAQGNPWALKPVREAGDPPDEPNRSDAIKQVAVSYAYGLPIDVLAIQNYDQFEAEQNTPRAFGVGIRGQTNPDDLEGTKDHPGDKGLNIIVRVYYNTPMLDPIYDALMGGNTIKLVGQVAMQNEGVNLALGGEVPEFAPPDPDKLSGGSEGGTGANLDEYLDVRFEGSLAVDVPAGSDVDINIERHNGNQAYYVCFQGSSIPQSPVTTTASGSALISGYTISLLTPVGAKTFQTSLNADCSSPVASYQINIVNPTTPSIIISDVGHTTNHSWPANSLVLVAIFGHDPNTTYPILFDGSPMPDPNTGGNCSVTTKADKTGSAVCAIPAAASAGVHYLTTAFTPTAYNVNVTSASLLVKGGDTWPDSTYISVILGGHAPKHKYFVYLGKGSSYYEVTGSAEGVTTNSNGDLEVSFLIPLGYTGDYTIITQDANTPLPGGADVPPISRKIAETPLKVFIPTTPIIVVQGGYEWPAGSTIYANLRGHAPTTDYDVKLALTPAVIHRLTTDSTGSSPVSGEPFDIPNATSSGDYNIQSFMVGPNTISATQVIKVTATPYLEIEGGNLHAPNTEITVLLKNHAANTGYDVYLDLDGIPGNGPNGSDAEHLIEAGIVTDGNGKVSVTYPISSTITPTGTDPADAHLIETRRNNKQIAAIDLFVDTLDLTVTDIRWPEDPQPGVDLPIFIDVTNNKAITLTGIPFDNDLYINPPKDVPTYTQQLPPGDRKIWIDQIGPNQTRTITTTIRVFNLGTYQLWGRADTTDKVGESLENNNLWNEAMVLACNLSPIVDSFGNGTLKPDDTAKPSWDLLRFGNADYGTGWTNSLVVSVSPQSPVKYGNSYQVETAGLHLASTTGPHTLQSAWQAPVIAPDNSPAEAEALIPLAQTTETVLDNFNAQLYSNNNGTKNWANNWTESGDDNSADSGEILITGNVLQVERGTDRIIQREANLLGATAATLSFTYQRYAINDSNEGVALDISNNGGSSWTNLTNFTNGDDSSYQNYSVSIASYIASNTRIRFRTYELENNEGVRFDDVQISYTVPPYPAGCGGTPLTNPLTANVDTSLTIGAGLPGYAGQNADGSQTYVCGDGTDIWNANDQFHYAYTNSFSGSDGDGDFIARVTNWNGSSDPWSKAGIMIRETTDTNAKYAIVSVTGNNGVKLQYTGNGTAPAANNGITAPIWLRLKKTGDLIETYTSANGTTWTPLASTTLNFTNYLVGFAVTAHDNGEYAWATFDNVSFTAPTPSPTPTPTPIPDPSIRVNFQTNTSPVPVTGFPDYLVDVGYGSGNRGNGYTYGWILGGTPTDNTDTRDRDSGNSPDQRYDTLNHMQKSANYSWEIVVPNGTYTVTIVAGDPDYTDSNHQIAAEGQLVVSENSSSTGNRFGEGTRQITVTDGKLTISPASGSVNAKIDYIIITPANVAPTPTPTATEPTPTPTATSTTPTATPTATAVVTPGVDTCSVSGEAGNILHLCGSGMGIMANDDDSAGYLFFHRPINSQGFDMAVQLKSLPGQTADSLAGLEVRETTNGNALKVSLVIKNGNPGSVGAFARTSPGGSVSQVGAWTNTDGLPPTWLRIVRANGQFYFYYNARVDTFPVLGAWNLLGSVADTMGANVEVGMINATGNNARSESTWSDFRITCLSVPTAEECGVVNESNGQTIINAINYTDNVQSPTSADTWQRTQTPTGNYPAMVYYGANYTNTINFNSADYFAKAPSLEYGVNIHTAGVYYVWLLGYSPDNDGDSIHLGFDGARETYLADPGGSGLHWFNAQPGGDAYSKELGQGVHTLNFWGREDDFQLVQILVTNSPPDEYIPTSTVPTGQSACMEPVPPEFPAYLEQCSDNLLQQPGFETGGSGSQIPWIYVNGANRGSGYRYTGAFGVNLPATNLLGYPSNRAPELQQKFNMPDWINETTTMMLSLKVAVLKAPNPDDPIGLTYDSPNDHLYLTLRNKNQAALTAQIPIATGADNPPGGSDSNIVPPGTPAEDFNSLNNRDLINDFLGSLLDLQDLGGQTIEARFYAPNPAETNPGLPANDPSRYSTVFWMDDLNLEVCTNQPPPTLEDGKGTIKGELQVLFGSRAVRVEGVTVWAYIVDKPGPVNTTYSVNTGFGLDNYSFYNLEPGDYVVYAEYTSADGTTYGALRSVTVAANRTSSLDLSLLVGQTR